MNYRQWKKKYKKLPGHNPPSRKKVKEWGSLEAAQAAVALGEFDAQRAAQIIQDMAKAIKPALATAFEVVGAALMEFSKAFKATAESLRESEVTENEYSGNNNSNNMHNNSYTGDCGRSG